jgi:hypothetical protein
MTIKKALIVAIALPDVSDDELEKASVDHSLSLDTEYDSSLKRKVDIAAISVLKNRLNINSLSEGGLSLGYNVDGLKQRIILLANEHGLTGLIAQLKQQPKIRPIKSW